MSTIGNYSNFYAKPRPVTTLSSLPSSPPLATLPSVPPPFPRPTYSEACSSYYRFVYKLCYKITNNPTLAEDLTQDTFLHLRSKLHLFRGESSFSTWLYSLTRNLVRMHLRKGRKAELESLEGMLEMGDGKVGGNGSGADSGRNDGRRLGAYQDILLARDRRLEFADGRAALWEAIDSLPEGYRTILLLYDYEGYQHNEIAAKLGIHEGTSKSQLFKARLLVREKLTGKVGVTGGRLRRRKREAPLCAC